MQDAGNGKVVRLSLHCFLVPEGRLCPACCSWGGCWRAVHAASAFCGWCPVCPHLSCQGELPGNGSGDGIQQLRILNVCHWPLQTTTTAESVPAKQDCIPCYCTGAAVWAFFKNSSKVCGGCGLRVPSSSALGSMYVKESYEILKVQLSESKCSEIFLMMVLILTAFITIFSEGIIIINVFIVPLWVRAVMLSFY